eukprot:scaffold18638_cov35-Cyclotella_meneghiniana.AAC.2
MSDRCNPYRKVIYSYLKGSGEMVALQKLAVLALRGVLSKVDALALTINSFRSSTSDVCKALGSNIERVETTLDCICRSIVNKAVTLDGWWKVSFNRTAAKTLLDVINNDSHCISFVHDKINQTRLEAANFLLSLPIRLDEKSRESTSKNNGKSNSVDKQHLETWLLDRFYFDQPNKSSASVVEHVYRLDDGQCAIEVFGSESINQASELLCEDLRVVDNMLVSETKGNTPFHCAATWALTCLSLDAFCVKLSEMKAAIDDNQDSTSDVEVCQLLTKSSAEDSLSSDSFMHLSPKLATALQDESFSSKKSSQKTSIAPEHGSIVGLVGKAAFPCVCEVTPSFASLFTGRTCVSNEGVQWQSLYLVVIGKFAVLAEPERSGSGGEGRVIMACKLACLAVKKDTSVLANNNTPARRLLMQHCALDQELPPLFVVESSSSDKRHTFGQDRLHLTRSRVDLWFEDSNACSVAWKALAGKIAKARAKRGSRIMSALLEKKSSPLSLQTESDESR